MPSHIIILNWNSATDTVECLQNVLAAKAPAKLVVADNASSDDSVFKIKSWAQAAGVALQCIEEDQVSDSGLTPADYDVVLILNSANHGFAGGNNPAIRFALPRSSDGYIWLLNNDARIDNHTFPEIISKFDSDSSLGFVGSVIRYYEKPDELQCYGGCVIYPRIGKRKLYGKGTRIEQIGILDESEVDYLMGASLAIRPAVIQDVGVMETAYFMYAEEMDWQLRARARGWRIGVAKDSNVFHKGAASTSGRSHMYHYYLNRASSMFTTRFFGRKGLFTALPALALIITLQNFKHPRNILYGWKGMIEGALYRWDCQHPFPSKKGAGHA